MKKSTLILLTGMFLAATVHAGSISVKGSDTLLNLAQKWAEVYMGKHPEVKIVVNGGGSGTGFAGLLNHEIDIADASRPIKPAEKLAYATKFNAIPTEYKVAVDGLSVYVNAASTIKELSIEQLRGIFTGQTTNWSQVGGSAAPITIYSRENSSGTYEFFKEHVLKGKDFAATAQTMPGTAALVQAIEKDPNGIGYGGAAYTAGARAIAVKKDAASPAILPSEETVLNGTYPIWRYLFNYVGPASDKGEIASYLVWIRGDEGQSITKEVGYYPLPKELRSK